MAGGGEELGAAAPHIIDVQQTRIDARHDGPQAPLALIQRPITKILALDRRDVERTGTIWATARRSSRRCPGALPGASPIRTGSERSVAATPAVSATLPADGCLANCIAVPGVVLRYTRAVSCQRGAPVYDARPSDGIRHKIRASI